MSDRARITVGQTEPPLTIESALAFEYGINAAGYNIFFNMKNKVTGVLAVTAGVGTITTGLTVAILSYPWLTGETDISAVYDGQFRAVRKTDSRILFLDKLPVLIHPGV